MKLWRIPAIGHKQNSPEINDSYLSLLSEGEGESEGGAAVFSTKCWDRRNS